jgi:hypothetical protein
MRSREGIPLKGMVLKGMVLKGMVLKGMVLKGMGSRYTMALLLLLVVASADAGTFGPAPEPIKDPIIFLAAGQTDVVIYRGVIADLAVMLAPAAVRRRTRGVIAVESPTGGVVFAVDKRLRVLCMQTGKRRAGDPLMLWGGRGCGW